MQDEPSDVGQIIEYRADAEIVRLLPTGLFAVLVGLALFALSIPDLPDRRALLAATGALLAGIGIIGFSLWRSYRRGRPIFVLSPKGIHLRIGTVKQVLIPWREIRAIDTVDITARLPGWRRSHEMTFHDVTAVRVSRQFYQSRIHVGSFFLRGPGWSNNFLDRGAEVACALHHALVSVAPQALRAEVETRWRAFRDQPAAPRGSVPRVSAAARDAGDPVVPAAPGVRVIAAGDNPRAVTWWEAVKIIVPLIGIVAVSGNLIGLWRTEGQIAAYAKQREWAETTARWERERKELDERLEKQRREFDEHMRRAFGR